MTHFDQIYPLMTDFTNVILINQEGEHPFPKFSDPPAGGGGFSAISNFHIRRSITLTENPHPPHDQKAGFINTVGRKIIFLKLYQLFQSDYLTNFGQKSPLSPKTHATTHQNLRTHHIHYFNCAMGCTKLQKNIGYSQIYGKKVIAHFK